MNRAVQAAPLLPPPIELGAPERFSEWRKFQDQAVLDIMASDKRFIFCAMPTGSGKSLTGFIQQLLCSGRLSYLTSSKALQQQLMDDFEVSGLVQVKGQNAYVCRLAAEEAYSEGGRTVMVDGGACHGGYFCRYMDGGCGYFDAVNAARARDLIVTNYSFWMTSYAYSDGLGVFDTLICDEGHAAIRLLTGFLAFAFDQADAGRVKKKLLSPQARIEDWRQWGDGALARVKERLEARQQEIKSMQDSPDTQRKLIRNVLREIKDLKDLSQRLESLTVAEGEWVIDHRDTYVEFSPLRPASYAEKFLFLGIKKVIVMSATLTTKDAEQLNIAEDQMDYFEYPSTFPVKNRPIYRIPTVSVKYDTSEQDMKKWDTRIDQIVESRLDRKGIIHTHSFKLAKRIQQNSKWSDIMFFNTSENTRAMVEKFKNADPPAVLVSPSVSTGFDFDGDFCRYQIIGKVPFPNTDSAVIKAWRELDPDYAFHLAMQTVTQAYGRGNRSEHDFCECFVIDENFGWFIGQYGCNCGHPFTCTKLFNKKPRKHFAPKYFLDAIIWADHIPTAPKLEE